MRYKLRTKTVKNEFEVIRSDSEDKEEFLKDLGERDKEILLKEAESKGFIIRPLDKSFYKGCTKEELAESYKTAKRFRKEDRSSFPYWFAHWCAFQLVALNLGIWKPRHLLHDIEKPWLKLFMPYSKVKSFHVRNSRHHLGYKDSSKIRWIDLVIDWECCGLTKENAPLDARETLEAYRTKEPLRWGWIKSNVESILDKLGL